MQVHIVRYGYWPLLNNDNDDDDVGDDNNDHD